MITRLPLWIDLHNNSRVFTWLHYSKKRANKHAYIIVGPVGPEYMHTHRAQRLLADKLASLGHLAVRYDHVGMGNSTGSLEDAGIWNDWIATPGAIRRHIETEFDICNFTLVGFRSGSLLLESYINSFNDENIIYLFPYTRGAVLVRDMQILGGLSNLNHDIKETTLEGGGYPFTSETQCGLKKANLLKESFNNYKRALVVENGEALNKSALSSNLDGCKVEVKTLYMSGLSAMARQAELSIVPENVIESICEWVALLPNNHFEEFHQVIISNALESENYVETPIFIDANPSIFGVLTQPVSQKKQTDLLILTNSGSGHHVGPNRFHVGVARQIAEFGIATFRMDLSNLGDSLENFDRDMNHPYPVNSTNDLNLVLDYFSKKMPFQNIILGGLCSGAHNAFHAAICNQDNNLRGLILINILTFYWESGQSILFPEGSELEINATEYQNNIFNYRKWLALGLNPSKFPRLMSFIIRLILKKIEKLRAKLLLKLGAVELTKLEKDINSIIENNRKVYFVNAENEPAYKILMSQAGSIIPHQIKLGTVSVCTIKNADHTFSSRQARERLVNAIIKSCEDMVCSANGP